MITPDDQLPLDDSETEDDEQLSQQDIHSNGFDEDAEYEAADEEADVDGLKQAYDASEPSYTLNLDDDDLDED
ncbi:MAG: hypothetical protein JWR50_2408 [Mucilaginibacter sp.]|nr:hypothetical protein [Mucilaginibacter sp.]